MNFELIGRLYAFLVGLVVGSFANVCIYRMPLGFSVVSPRSKCVRCGSKISWFDNLPVLSFVFLRGRCRYCRVPIGFRYPLIEILTGISSVWIYERMGLSIQSVYVLLLVTSMLIVTFIDLDHRIIPDSISISGVFVGLAMAALTSWLAWDWFVSFREALYGAFLGAFLPWVVRAVYEWLTGREGLGMGDVKLLALVGAHVGVEGVLSTLFYGSALGFLVGASLIWIYRKGRRFPIPFGPFLCFGWLIYVLVGSLFRFL